MSRSFKAYKELITEKEKLQQLLTEQKKLIRADIDEIKLQVKPLSEIRSHVRKFTMRNGISLLLTLNSDLIIKKIFEKIASARAGWFGKVLVPYLIKNYSSPGFLTRQKKKLSRWLRLWFKREFKNPTKNAGSSADIQ